ncbi:hypothetical protein PV11_02226 [Exophiala sideris]|uniref:MaoC-like domain-containing protein n=1 Tax=Exophiala sideris TaxID=1016849 RepID=A0A0D1XEY4_9EURO|nr:hypothetical protein PV11_02226 [Exophiala sideris]
MRQSLRPFKSFHRQSGQRWVRHSTSNTKPRSGTPFDFLRDISLEPPAGTWDIHNINSFYHVLKDHLALAAHHSIVRPGFQQVSFNEFLRERDLCVDGGDRRYAPGDEWKYRVWAGGSMKFYKASINPSPRQLIFPSEKVSSVRVVGNPADEDAKVFVTLTKMYHEAEFVPGSTNLLPIQDKEPVIREDKHLCFMRNIPSNLRSLDSLRKIPPPGEHFHAQTMKPTPALLFRFSALTSNDHRIHIDPDFTRREYGVPNLLVHGPLTAVLMLEVLRKGHGLFTKNRTHRLTVTGFDYKNLLPLFVNETITIACKPSDIVSLRELEHESEGRATLERWDVWIQKGDGENATVVARGTAILAPTAPQGKTVDWEDPD